MTFRLKESKEVQLAVLQGILMFGIEYRDINIINMDVNQESQDVKHLLSWATSETTFLKSSAQHYTLHSILHSGDLCHILVAIDDSFFTSISNSTDSMEDIFGALQEFINKQCGKRIKLALKNKVLKNFQIETLVSLALYACLHSKKKSEFIQRIMEFSEEEQAALMRIIQEISGETESILEIKDILLRVEQLQLQAENLKKQLGLYTSREHTHILAINELEEDLHRSHKDIKTFKQEKQTAIQTLKLSNFEEYLLSFQKLQHENTMLNKYAQELEQKNEEGQNLQKQLKKCLKDQLGVISDLNDQITHMKEKYNALKLEKINGFVNDQTLDASRSFGYELMNSSKDNLEISHIQKNSKNIRFSELAQDWLEEENKENGNQIQLQTEIGQLRKYNTELMQKLDGVYQTVQTLTNEASNMRERNRNLKKENRFYKRQIEDLRKLHHQFEKRYFAGEF